MYKGCNIKLTFITGYRSDNSNKTGCTTCINSLLSLNNNILISHHISSCKKLKFNAPYILLYSIGYHIIHY